MRRDEQLASRSVNKLREPPKFARTRTYGPAFQIGGVRRQRYGNMRDSDCTTLFYYSRACRILRWRCQTLIAVIQRTFKPRLPLTPIGRHPTISTPIFLPLPPIFIAKKKTTLSPFNHFPLFFYAFYSFLSLIPAYNYCRNDPPALLYDVRRTYIDYYIRFLSIYRFTIPFQFKFDEIT